MKEEKYFFYKGKMNSKVNEFLNSNIRCSTCRKGASSFSIIFNESQNKYISKWGDYCSLFCLINLGSPKKKIEVKPTGLGG